MKLILASNSPRRREILQTLGLHIEVLVSDAAEDCDRTAFTPEELVMGLACRKARAVQKTLDALERNAADYVLLAADTVVALDGQILEKPADDADARRMLHALSGRRHEVYTGIAVIHNHTLAVDVQTTGVRFRTLSDAEIDRYIASGEHRDKAGAYGIQQKGGLFVEGIDGDYFNVVGLPVVRTNDLLLRTFGFDLLSLESNFERNFRS